MVEKIIFNLLAFAIFIIVFVKFIRKNDTSYVYILGIEFLGIVINFIELIFSIKLNLFLKIIIYLLSIIIPGAILIIEHYKKVDFPEMLNTLLAKIALKNGDTEKAKKYLFKLINKYPNSYLGHKILAEVYEKEENYALAVDEYIRATEINNKDIKVNLNLARLLNMTERHDDAITMLQDILKKKPDYYDATDLLGEILYSNGMYKEAINVYMNALKYHPDNYDLYYNLGMVCTMVNDFQRAKEFYEKAAEINALLYNAKFSIGQIALIEGDLDEAEKYFKESLEGEDVESGSYYYLSQIAMLRGDKDKAINYMNLAVELNPDMYKKMQKENLFGPIREYVRKPDRDRRAKRTKMTLKERKAINHLSKTCSLSSNLNNTDIEMMKRFKEKEKEKYRNQKIK